MANKRTKGIKTVIFIGYISLFLLVVLGLAKIYQELVQFTKIETISKKDNKELKLISNTLLTLYKSKSGSQVLLPDELSLSSKRKNDSLENRTLTLYIDSLYSISNDPKLHLSLDTVNDLLSKKEENLHQIMDLMEAIRQLPYSKIMSKKVISKQAVADLTKMIAKSTVTKKDTTLYIKKKKSFFGKVKSVFSDEKDSVKVISKTHKKKQLDSVYATPSKIVADTVITYVNTMNALSNRKKIAYMAHLSNKQTKALYYDKLLTQQIQTILLRLETKEKERLQKLAKERERLIKKSSKVVSTIAIIALLVLILFITVSFIQINKVLKYSEKLEQNNKYIDFLAKSREKLLLIISHDIKAPLSSIIGHIELLAREKRSKEEEESLNNMRHSSEQILDLSHKLLKYHELEKGKYPVNKTLFEPYDLIKNSYKSYQPIVLKKGLLLKCKNNLEKNESYSSDPFILNQILNNLVSNAIKFTEKGVIEIVANIEKSILTISVKDTGRGISESEKKKIFGHFQRGGTVVSQQNIEGSGLGLSITLRLVELLKGQILLDTELGKGSTFTVKIPLEKAEENKNKKTSENQEIDLIGKRVLAIDDDVTMLTIYSNIIKKSGAKITVCNQPLDAIDILKNQTFDIIFTDIQMPKMNGFELVKEIRSLGKKYQQIPIIGLSARSDISVSELEKVGFSDFMEKPLDIKKLLLFVKNSNNLLETKTPHSASEQSCPSSDFDSLIEFVKDDKQMSLEIMQTFLEDNQNKSNQLQKALQQKDNQQIQSIAHKALPLMRMIKDNTLVAFLEKMEQGNIDFQSVEKAITLLENKNKEIEKYISQNLK